MNIFGRKRKKERSNKYEFSRQSNFELMRIISMFMIILCHVIHYGDFIKQSSGAVKIIITFIQSLLYVHVPSFVLLCGYFQCKNKFKLSKFFSLYNQVWFYRVVITIALACLGIVAYTKMDFIKNISYLYYGDYWFITVYFVLYLCSPMLNIVINNIDRKQHLKIIVLLLLLFSILPTLTAQAFYPNTRGYSITTFILLYFIGSYLRLYPIDMNSIFSHFTKNFRKYFFLSVYIFLGFVLCMQSLLINLFISSGGIVGEVGKIMESANLSYDNPIIVLQSICYFLLFYSMSFKNKFINRIALCMIGIYLIHDNNYLRNVIYEIFWFNSKSTYFGNNLIVNLFIFSIIIMIVSCLIEFVRQIIFKFIYNRKISYKLRGWFYKFISSFGISIV